MDTLQLNIGWTVVKIHYYRKHDQTIRQTSFLFGNKVKRKNMESKILQNQSSENVCDEQVTKEVTKFLKEFLSLN